MSSTVVIPTAADSFDEKLAAVLALRPLDAAAFADVLREIAPDASVPRAGAALIKRLDRHGRPALATVIAAIAPIEQAMEPLLFIDMAREMLANSPHPFVLAAYLRCCNRAGTLADPIVAETYIGALTRAPARWRPAILQLAKNFSGMDDVVACIFMLLREWRDVEGLATCVVAAASDSGRFRDGFLPLLTELGQGKHALSGNAADLYSRVVVPALDQGKPEKADLLPEIVSALRQPESSALRPIFKRIAQDGPHDLFDLWDIAMQSRYAALFAKLSQEFGLAQADQRLNFVLAMANIGDTSACLAFMAPIASTRGRHINIMLPDTRTNGQLASFFAHDMITFHLVDRERIMSLPPWIEVAPQTPGVIHGFSMGGDTRLVLGPNVRMQRNRLGRMRALFGLPDDTSYASPAIWRTMGDVSTVLQADWNRTVMVAPISVSLRNRMLQHTRFTHADFDRMWELMLDALIDAGWTPIINGRNHHYLLQRFSERIVHADLTLAEFLQAVSRSRAFIGERSGLHELVAITGAGKTGAVFAVHPEGFLYVPNVGENACNDVTIDPLRGDLNEWLRNWVVATLGNPSEE